MYMYVRHVSAHVYVCVYVYKITWVFLLLCTLGNADLTSFILDLSCARSSLRFPNTEARCSGERGKTDQCSPFDIKLFFLPAQLFHFAPLYRHIVSTLWRFPTRTPRGFADGTTERKSRTAGRRRSAKNRRMTNGGNKKNAISGSSPLPPSRPPGCAREAYGVGKNRVERVLPAHKPLLA